jgi:exonuclease SbcC
MRILAIRGQNLASLAEKFEIDLTAEPLAGTGLFAITGETGAGKSTILDALCLALYGNYPRASVEKRERILDPSDTALQVSDPRNILRRGAGEGWAEADFIGVDGLAYTARWAVRRARDKATGKLQKVDRTLERCDGTQTVATGVEAVLEAVIEKSGFTFEEFRRSVLLAQGEFDAFLLADETQRAALLEKITGTEIYSRISRRVFEETSAREQALKAREAECNAIGVRTEEEIAAEQEEEARLVAVRRATEAEFSAVEAVLTGLDALRRAQTALVEGTAGKQRAARARSEAEGDLQTAENRRTTKFDVCQNMDAEVRLLEPAWQEALRLDGRIADAQERLRAAAESLDEAKRREAQTADRLRRLHEDKQAAEAGKAQAVAALAREAGHALLADQEQRLIESLGAYATLAQRLGSEKTDAERAAGEIERLQAVIAEADAAAAAAREEKLKLSARIAERRAALDAMDDPALSEREGALLAADREIGQILETLRRRDHAAGVLETARAQVQAASAEEEKLSGTADEVHAGLEQGRRARTELAQLSDLADAALSRQAAQMRSVLVDGEPCPVCGAPEHPYAHGDDAATELAQGIKAKRAAIDAEIAVLTATLQETETARSRASGQMKQALDTIAAIEPELAAVQAALASRYPDCVRLVTALAGVAPRPGGISQLNVADLEQARQACGTARTAVADSRRRAKALASEIDDLRDAEAQLGEKIDKTAAAQDAERRSLFDVEKAQSVRRATLSGLREQLESKHRELGPALAPAGLGADDLDRDVRGVTRRIASLAEAYRRLVTAHERAGEHLAGLLVDIGLAENDLSHVAAVRERAEKDVSVRSTELERALAERAKLLDGEETELHRKRYLERQAIARQEMKAADEEVAGARLTLARAEEALAAEERTLAAAITSVEAARFQLARAATAAAADEAAVQALLAGSDGGAQPYVDRRAQLSLALDDVKGQLVLLADARARDERARVTAAALRAAVDESRREFDVWNDVNEAIGQSDGAKFRRFAQSVTLGHLVVLANSQLALLNPRYQLRRGTLSDLALDVVDRDMGEEIRSPRSLSGGERFLVSLALALALSGLEGRQSFVDTLFIDEGFGSLDRDTLEFAITALESLQGQGRKVGVITHVPAMIEQIAVQVRVEKRGGGRSIVRTRQIGAQIGATSA